MGDDTAMAPLARAPRPLYAFFRQRFAQVTNPPIDPLRETVVLQMHTRLGPWPHLLEVREPLPGLSLRSPILTLGQMHALRHGAPRPGRARCRTPFSTASILPTPHWKSLSTSCARGAIELVANGASLLILSDREATPDAIPIPMAMAAGAVHMALTAPACAPKSGSPPRPRDCREIHHVAVLLGLGAGAVCPWLALETARTLNPEKGEENLLRALELGLAKVMSKMGISVLDSYCAAHLFDAIGINSDRCRQVLHRRSRAHRRHRLRRDRAVRPRSLARHDRIRRSWTTAAPL